MRKIDYEKHAEWVVNTPRVKAGDTLIVIHKDIADKIVEAGEWDNYKHKVIVSKNLKAKCND